MKALITISLLNKLKPEMHKRYDVWDTKLSGFHLRVFPSGKMSYRFLYARGKDYTIGSAEAFTVAEARERAKKVMGLRADGEDPLEERKKARHSQTTLKQFIEKEYAPWATVHLKSGKAFVDRVSYCFGENFGDKYLSEIQTLKIEQWRTQRLSAAIKPATINRDIEALRAALSKAVEWGFLEHHPLKNLKRLKVDSVSKVRYLNQEEEQHLRNALDNREATLKAERKRGNDWRSERGYELLPDLSKMAVIDYLKPMVLLSLNTGMRRGEVFDLQWENMDFKQSLIAISGETTKSGKTRHIPLNSEALNILKSWYAQQDKKTGLVFPGKDGARFNNVKKIWGTLLKKAGIKNFRWHDMRHHFASRLVMLGVDLNTVRELLGHSDITMTLRYAHLAPEHKANAVAKLIETKK